MSSGLHAATGFLRMDAGEFMTAPELEALCLPQVAEAEIPLSMDATGK